LASAANNGYLAAFAAHHSVIDRKLRPADTRTIQHPPVMRLMRKRWALVHQYGVEHVQWPVHAFFAGGGCGVLAGGFDGSNCASSIAHCLIGSSSVSDAL